MVYVSYFVTMRNEFEIFSSSQKLTAVHFRTRGASVEFGSSEFLVWSGSVAKKI